MYGDGSLSWSESTKRWVYYWYPAKGENRRKRTFKTKKEANDFIRSMRDDKMAPIRQYPLLGEWCVTYLNDYKKHKLLDTSFQRSIQTSKKLAPIATIPINELTGEQIQKLYTNMCDEGLSSSTISKVHILLGELFKKAIALRKVDYNPVLAATPPSIKKEATLKLFTFREILRLFRTLRRNQYYKSWQPLFYLLLTTGMRIGEALALKWNDVDLENREIYVHTSKVSNTNKCIIRQPKTERSIRYIPILSDRVAAILSDLESKANSQYVFATKNGTALDYHNVRRAWLKICELSNITLDTDKDIEQDDEEHTHTKGMHTFRHTFASVLLSKGVPIQELSRILGHANVSITFNCYIHSIPNYNDKLLVMFSKQAREKQKAGA